MDKPQKLEEKNIMVKLPTPIQAIGFWEAETGQQLPHPAKYSISGNFIKLTYSFTGVSIVGDLLAKEMIAQDGQTILVYHVKAKEPKLIAYVSEVLRALKEQIAAANKEQKEEKAEIVQEEVKASTKKASKKAKNKK